MHMYRPLCCMFKETNMLRCYWLTEEGKENTMYQPTHAGVTACENFLKLEVGVGGMISKLLALASDCASTKRRVTLSQQQS